MFVCLQQQTLRWCPAAAQYVCIGACACDQQHLQCPAVHLEQQLILHDPLDRFDEQVVELQPVTQLLPELLKAETHTTPINTTATAQNTRMLMAIIISLNTINHRDYTVCPFFL